MYTNRETYKKLPLSLKVVFGLNYYLSERINRNSYQKHIVCYTFYVSIISGLFKNSSTAEMYLICEQYYLHLQLGISIMTYDWRFQAERHNIE